MQQTEFNEFSDSIYETKTKDTDITDLVNTILSISGTTPCLVAQGAEYDERIGRKIWAKRLLVRCEVEWTPTALTDQTSDMLYMWVVLDRQANGTVPAVTDVFTTSEARKALIFPPNQQRFSIIGFKMVPVWSHTRNTGTPRTMTKAFNMSIDIDLPIEFKGTTGTTANLVKNNLWIFSGCSKTTNEISLEIETRLEYIG